MNDTKSDTYKNNEAISNLIESIQSKLNNENKIEDEKNVEQTENIKEVSNSSNNTNTTINDFNLNDILSLLNNSKDKNKNNNFNLSDIDPTIFSKIQKILLSLKKEDPKKDLLNSLKPFLRKSRQDKIGEYITILTLIKAFEAFNDKGSDENE